MKKKVFLSILMFALISSLFGLEKLTHKDFFVLFNHKINESYKKINLLNKKPNIAKLGKEEVAGNISGKVFYHAKISGLGGLVTIRYENYCDEKVGFLTEKLSLVEKSLGTEILTEKLM